MYLLEELLQLFTEVGILNYWMFAMITIACIFIVFVGVSIYILWYATYCLYCVTYLLHFLSMWIVPF